MPSQDGSHRVREEARTEMVTALSHATNPIPGDLLGAERQVQVLKVLPSLYPPWASASRTRASDGPATPKHDASARPLCLGKAGNRLF